MKFVAILACSLVAGPAFAGAPALTLIGAQAEARSHAPEVGVLSTLVSGATAIARDRQRRLRSDPQLSGSYRSGVTTGDAGDRIVSLGLDWTVDLSGEWRDARNAAEVRGAQASAAREAGLAALDEAVAVAVADLSHAQRQLARVTKIEALFRIGYDAARRLLDTSQGTQLDVDAAELDLAVATAKRKRSARALESAQIALARLLGRARHTDLVVDDPAAVVTPPSSDDLAAIVVRDPRVRAAEDAARAAGYEVRAADRPTWTAVSVGFDFEYVQHEIPRGSIAGDPTLGARWHDWEAGIRIGIPLPLFDRRRELRTRTRSDAANELARLAVVRADVTSELEGAATNLRAALDVWQTVSVTATTIDREYDLLDKAFRAGALDVSTRALHARRLVEAGEQLDSALRDVRVTWAAWIRATVRPAPG
jgi:outer membrane protein TolC